jgi:hypothetical protein
MTLRTLPLIAAFCAGALGVAPVIHADERQEPPLKHILEIDGRPHELVLGEPLQVPGSYANPKVRITAAASRVFSYGGVEFKYPEFFTWEADIEPGDKSWTLSGNDFKISFFAQDKKLALQDYVDALETKFKKPNVRVQGKSRLLGGTQYDGKLLVITLASVKVSIEVYALPTKQGSRLLMLQDSPPDDALESPEGATTLALLARTFKDKQASGPVPKPPSAK